MSNLPLSGCELRRLPIADPLALADLAAALRDTYLVWDAYTGGRRRVDVHPLVLSRAEHARAVVVARAAYAAAARASDRAFADRAESLRYRLPDDVRRLAEASREAGDLASLVRVDLLRDAGGGFVACEINADCPGGHNEALGLPRLAIAAGARGLSNPTRVVDALVDRLVARSGGPGSPRGAVGLVFATAWAEDLQVCALLERLVTARGGRAVRVSSSGLSRAPGGGLRYRGEGLSVLYRFFPTEYMEGGAEVGDVCAAVSRGEVETLSSFACMYMQSKLSMARALALDPLAPFPDTVPIAELDPERLERDRAEWVLKRALSRVGEHVIVGAATEPAAFRDVAREARERDAHEEEPWIAQRFVRQAPVHTKEGPRWLTLGVYLLDGAFVGYFARLSSSLLASHEALVVPVLVEADPGGGAA